MRLSEIRGERAIDVIAEITEPVLNIAMDDDAVAMFRGVNVKEGEDASKAVMAKFKTAIPLLMREHKDDLVAIMASLEGVDKDEYLENLTMSKLLGGVYEMLTDEDLLAFLS